MKKIVTIILTLILYVSITPFIVEAKSEIINKKGVVMTQEEYNILNTNFGYSEEVIMNIFTQNMFDTRIKGTHEGSETKYFRTETFYNVINNELIKSINTQITKEELEKSETTSIIIPYGQIHQTTYKTLRIDVWHYGSGASIELYNYWTKDPVARTYDVIAIRWNNAFTLTDANGYQSAFSPRNSQYYSYGGANMNIQNNGVGISMNLFNNGTDIDNALYIDGNLSGPYAFNGSFQHCTASSISLADSKNYTFSSSGLGGVIKFGNTTIANKYDGMQGVDISN